MEELGRACLPGPYTSTVVGLKFTILMCSAPVSQKSEILPNLTWGRNPDSGVLGTWKHQV